MDFKKIMNIMKVRNNSKWGKEDPDEVLLSLTASQMNKPENLLDSEKLEEKKRKSHMKKYEKVKELDIQNKETENIIIENLAPENEFPPKLSQCADHEKAMKVGRDDPNDLQICQCCGYQVS